MKSSMSISLQIWRQETPLNQGKFQIYKLQNVSPNISLLEAIDQLNEQLITSEERPINFDHDCR